MLAKPVRHANGSSRFKFPSQVLSTASIPRMVDKMRSAEVATPGRADLLKAANDLERTAAGFWSDHQINSAQQLLSAWSRARAVYAEITGEDLSE
jgi:hypothetical protein